jgi:tetratricopeptide (TPR) repeat protein
MVRLRCCLRAAIVILVCCFALPAVAATKRQLDACNFKNSSTPQESVTGCTAHIKSGNWKGAGLGDFYNNRGMAYDKLGDKEHALADYNQALRLGPKNIHAYYNRGNLSSGKGDFDSAITDYTRAISINPKFVLAHYNRGNNLLSKGDAAAAVKDYTTVIKLVPEFGAAYTNRGNAQNVLKNYDAAIADTSMGLKLMPQDATNVDRAIPIGTRSAAYGRKNDWGHAIADINEAMRLNPTRQYRMARQATYDLASKPELAMPDVEELVRLDPKDAEAWTKRCLIRARVGRTDEALADCNHAIELNPHEGDGFAYRAFIYLKLKQFDKAIVDYNAALKVAGYVEGGPVVAPEYLYERGVARLRSGDGLGGAGDMAAAKAVKPELVEYYRRYGL